jgi:hypothetical protein
MNLDAYWIRATMTRTLFVRVDDNIPGASARSDSGIALPPMTVYGWLTPTAGFSPAIGMPVRAWIDDVLCGQTIAVELNGKSAYVMQVKALYSLGNNNICGSMGDKVVFQVGGQFMNEDRIWDNSQAWYHSLSQPLQPTNNELYLPVILKNVPVSSSKPARNNGRGIH